MSEKLKLLPVHWYGALRRTPQMPDVSDGPANDPRYLDLGFGEEARYIEEGSKFVRMTEMGIGSTGQLYIHRHDPITGEADDEPTLF